MKFYLAALSALANASTVDEYHDAYHGDHDHHYDDSYYHDDHDLYDGHDDYHYDPYGPHYDDYDHFDYPYDEGEYEDHTPNPRFHEEVDYFSVWDAMWT